MRPGQVATVSASVVQVDGSSVTGPVPSGNASITGRNLALQLSNMVDTAPTVGGKVTCTLMIVNNERFPVEGIQVEYPLHEQLGDKLRIEKIIPETGSYDSETGLWNIPSLAESGCGFLEIEALVLDARETDTLPLSARIIRAGGSACSFGSADASLLIQQPNAADYGSLAVTNTVTGAGADQDAAFPFEAVFKSADGTAMHSMGSYTKGAESGQFDTGEPFAFTLRHDETILLQVPNVLGYYTITETDSRGYLCSSPTATGKVQGSEPAAQALFVNEAIPVTSISLYPSQLSLYIGDSMALTATASPDNATNKTVFWSSNKPGVATVSDGTVTAVGVGTAVITATTQDGSFADTCTVTVTRPNSGSSGSSSTPTKTPSQQAINKIEAAKDGATVEIKLSTSQTKLDKEVFEELAGRDVTLEISLSNGVTWTVNGQDIPKNARLSDLDLGVSMNTSTIPVSVINAITGAVGTIQLSLKHDGAFGFTMTLTAPLGKENAGYWANLYGYDEDAGAMEFQAADRIASDGTASFPFSHASDYAIVIDDESHAPVELPFTDVPEGYWAYSEIAWAYESGYMSGTSAVSFAPGGTVSRQQVWMILARMAGENPADMVAAKAWAVANGISDGTNPGGAVTRQQLAALLYRYAAQSGYDVSVGEDTNILSYADASDVAEYAVPAMQWACGAGIIRGTGDGSTLTPQGASTRAQLTVMFYRWLA